MTPEATPGAPLALMPQRDAPGPRGLPFIGSILDVLRLGLLDLFTRTWKTYGDTFQLKVGRQRWLVLAHPDTAHHVMVGRREKYIKGEIYDGLRLLTGNGLLTAEGDIWAKRRRLTQGIFTRSSVHGQIDHMLTAIDGQLDRALADGPADVEALTFATHVTLRVAGWSFFGLDLSDRIDTTSKALVDALGVVLARSTNPFLPPMWVPTPGNLKLRRSLAVLDRNMYEIIDNAVAVTSDQANYVQRLIAARDEEDGQALPRQAIRDEVLSFYFAGHDTTSLTLAWTLHFLALAPELLEEVVAEVHDVLGDAPPTADDIPRMPLLRRAIDETLRLRPPAWSSARNCVANDVIDGYEVRKGDWVMPCQYLIHRHPAFWDEPDTYMPSRFAPEVVAKRPKPAYFPFSMGPRTCVGMYFALVEAPIVLARLLQRCHVEARFDAEVAPIVELLVRPKGPIPLRLTAR